MSEPVIQPLQPEGKQQPAKKYKVAIIEDDAAIVEMYKIKFEKEGYTVGTGADGNEGLALIEQQNPDIVLLDLMMPNKTGIEMLEELRGKPGGDQVKVMVLTNVGDDATTSQIYRLAPLDYIIKSEMTPQQVFDRVKKVLFAGGTEPLAAEQSELVHKRQRLG